ncbi:MAG: DUF166 domain-containing protein [Archaeoglobaceae archaeon]|nr:DUF166 domain-containing protein [Archaeoglobaceae archaeon]MCX8152590.1 DUF166 domain-containing protein [Archaeoglobaceae archaeon]MDW8014128.1 DUF166 family protein [Archaeoglobaceae archaeon]
MKVGVVARKDSRKREIELFSKFFEVLVYEIPKELPELIENPSQYLNFPENFKPEILVSFANHPDINIELIKEAAKRNVKIVIFSGSKAGSRAQLKNEAEKHGIKILVEEVCCTTPKIDHEFFEKFGTPEFEVSIEGDRLKEVKVLRAAFCGATFYVAEKIKGAKIDEAGRLAGYYTQIFPCLASRGIKGGIHKAAKAHKKAIEKAIKKAFQS